MLIELFVVHNNIGDRPRETTVDILGLVSCAFFYVLCREQRKLQSVSRDNVK